MGGGPVRQIIARVPGSCGELVQGAIAGVDIHVTCPIDRWGSAHFRPASRPLHVRAFLGALPRHPKVRLALGRYLNESGVAALPGRLELSSALPRGKGMGSSTADIVAALAATSAALKRPAGPDRLAGLALSVEPTDGTMFPGIAIFDHLHGRVRGSLGDPPPLEVLILDPGGRVNTDAFNRRPDIAEKNRTKEPAVREALALVMEGLRRSDPDAIGAAATLSARAHQAILHKEYLEPVAALAREVGAAGVCIAHSGVVVGILCNPSRTPAAAARPFLEQRLGRPLLPARVIGGGVRWASGSPPDPPIRRGEESGSPPDRGFGGVYEGVPGDAAGDILR